MTDPSAHAIATELAGLFSEYPEFLLTRGDRITYRQFRNLEPNLVSVLDELVEDGETIADVLTVHDASQPMGVVSFAVNTNRLKPGRRNRYARIDLVIVDPSYRGLGVGRLLLWCVITYLLRNFGGSLYSISSLAAHPAISAVLKELSFVGTPRENANFIHEELKLENLDLPGLTDRVAGLTTSILQLLKFRRRQISGIP